MQDCLRLLIAIRSIYEANVAWACTVWYADEIPECVLLGLICIYRSNLVWVYHPLTYSTADPGLASP